MRNVERDAITDQVPSLDAEAAAKAVVEEKKETKKLTLGQKVMKEVQHYWDGTKLLATEVRISTKLALKMAAGYELSRRENKQVWNDWSHVPPS
jgi:LETM1 and EF-hand domain-containing protein 1